MSEITSKQIDAILPYLDQFEQAGFSAGEWKGSPSQIPWFDFDETVTEFKKALYEHDWVTPSVNWTKWQAEAKRYVESPEEIDSVDAESIQKLFTTHVRSDRFCEGHLAAMFDNGHILRLLRRLKAIRHETS